MFFVGVFDVLYELFDGFFVGNLRFVDVGFDFEFLVYVVY